MIEEENFIQIYNQAMGLTLKNETTFHLMLCRG